MKRIFPYNLGFLCFVLFVCALTLNAQSQTSVVTKSNTEMDILSNTVSSNEIIQIVNNIDSWRINKRKQLKSDLLALPDSIKKDIIDTGVQTLNYDWPSLKAMVYLDYKLNGNRTNYESVNNKRRSKLTDLVKAELVEGKGRFIPQIINGLWLTLEESTWVSPAHLPTQKLGIGLPNIEDPYIDLGAGRQSVDVSLIYFFFQDEFDKVSKQINVRILHELNRRIINPYLDRDDYWWMTFKGSFVNNWNIWINTNVLKTFLLVESDKSKLSAGIEKVIQSSNKFVNYYPLDGACEEGPSYWMHAAGELGSMLSWLTDVSEGAINFSGSTKLKNMGSYIFHTHIDSNRYVNFADANSIENVSPIKVWNYFNVFNDVQMAAFASYLNKYPTFKPERLNLAEILEYSAIQNKISKIESNFIKPRYFYYESLGQVLYNNSVSNNNLFFSAIGSNNNVSHNHNDVGSFMLFYSNLPVFIDIGVGTYNAKTFSASRYDIWNMQSQWHNLPIINGMQQKAGKSFKSTLVRSFKEGRDFVYTLDISKAYPKGAAVKSWFRTYKLDTTLNFIRVTEDYILNDFVEKPELIFISKFKPKIINNGVSINLDTNNKALLIFSKSVENVLVEEQFVDDPRIQKVWGDIVYRVKVKLKESDKINKVEYSISFDSIRN